MRLLQPNLDDIARKELAAFSNWLLDIGNGNIGCISEPCDEEGIYINIPEDLIITCNGDPFAAIFRAIYVDFENNYVEPLYLSQRAIVTTYNETVDELNDFILNCIPANIRCYYSQDSISKSSIMAVDQELLYPTEFLNSLRFPGIPNHQLNLKIGYVVMLLRNINQSSGLCNGTRLIVT